MTQTGSLLSPVVVGRDDLLALADRRIEQVLAGTGQFLIASGEAGIGKTRLLSAIAERAAARGFRVARAEVAPQDRDVMAASFLDVGRSMRRDTAFGTIGNDLLEVIGTRLSASAPRRRDMVADIVDLLSASDRPTLLVFEDLQWSDDLSLETLTELARQTRATRLLMVGAFRSNDVAGSSVLREWRSRLVTQRLAEEVRLGRLSRDETAAMTTLILGSGLPAPRDVVDAVYARTDGVPLHIEELCSALGRDRLADSGAVLEAAVPETLEDATLGRIGRLSAEAQAVARAGAVMGRSFVPAVLAGIMNAQVDELDDPIQELVEHDILDPVERTGHFDFRHQLLRDVVYRSVPLGDRRRFHARAAEFGATLEGASSIHASVHFERAGMTDDAFRTALAAGRQAMAMSSHREAFDLLRRAIDNMPASLPDSERCRILLLFSDASGNLDRNGLCEEYANRARELALRIGEPFVALECLVNLAGTARRQGIGVTQRRDQARAMLNEADAAPATAERDGFRITALYFLAIVEQDACHFREARALLEEARELTVTPDAPTGALWLQQCLAQLDVIDGHVADGIATLRSIGETVRAHGDEDSGVSGYRDVALMSIRAMDFREASIGLDEGLRYAESVEQTFCGHWLQSSEALTSWADGRWDDAMRQGGHALSDPGSEGSHEMARWTLGYVEAGRGHRAAAEEHLIPALAWARGAERVDMLLQTQWGLAEAALHSGDAERAAALSDEALQLAREAGEWTFLAPFAVTGVRAHQAAGRPDAATRYLDQFLRAIGPGEEIARPSILHATGLVRLADGSIVAARAALESAVGAWDARGRHWEALWARLDLASALLRSARFADAMVRIREVRAEAERIGSEPLLQRATQLERVARGRGAEQEPWHPLSTREFEVAQRIAEGMTNAEVAETLGISPKTASAHVEHILAKLGVNRRAEIGAWAATVRASVATAPPVNGR